MGEGGENPLDSRGQGYWKIDGRLLPRAMRSLELKFCSDFETMCSRKGRIIFSKNRSLELE